MNRKFAPGCALCIYKPHLAERLHHVLIRNFGSMERLDTCCRNASLQADGDQVITVCSGCDRRYCASINSSTIPLWELLASSNLFPFPDYGGRKMTIIDACPTRDKARVHQSVRSLLERMRIELVEPQRTGTNSVCCGDSYWGVLMADAVKRKMAERAADMPVDDVVVYCVSCSKAMFIGGKKPHYLIDLLFEEETIPQTVEPADWHRELDDYIATH